MDIGISWASHFKVYDKVFYVIGKMLSVSGKLIEAILYADWSCYMYKYMYIFQSKLAPFWLASLSVVYSLKQGTAWKKQSP